MTPAPMSPAALTTQLHAAYTEESALYAQALLIAEQWSRRETAAAASLEQIAALLAQVERIEKSLAPAKVAWNDAGCRPTGALADSLARVADLIGQVQARLECARRQTEEQKHAIAPALDELIRSEHMRRAYGEARSMSPMTGGPGDGR